MKGKIVLLINRKPVTVINKVIVAPNLYLQQKMASSGEEPQYYLSTLHYIHTFVDF